MKKLLALIVLLSSFSASAQNVKISQIPLATTPLTGTELVPIVQDGADQEPAGICEGKLTGLYDDGG